MRAVVLLSGGIDSTVTMAIASSEGYEIYALSFDYGQRHKRELESAKRIVSHLGAKEHLIIEFDLRAIGGSALTSDIEVPKDREVLSVKRETINSELIPITYVPARNTIFLSFALAWAEVIKAEDIFIGTGSVDYSGYPDCRPEYIEAFERMANLATKEAVEGKRPLRIRCPLIKMTKAEIIKKGIGLGVDYSLTWSCYDPQPERVRSEDKNFELIPCGRCDSCHFREKGFREAGLNDPLVRS